MAFSRKRITSGQQNESLLDVPGEPPSALSSVRVAGLPEQAQDQIVDYHHNTSGCPFGHVGGVFMESDISAIMQARFDEPMLASD